MSARTGIEWTDATWNPVRGCSPVSPGCRHCYAERVAARFSGGPFLDGGQVVIREASPFAGFAVSTPQGPRWTGKVALVEEHLFDPLRWKEPRRIFVNSMSDLFHEGLPDKEIAAIFGVMAACPQHTFQVLTKRPARMLEWFRWVFDQDAGLDGKHGLLHCVASALAAEVSIHPKGDAGPLHRKRCADPAGPWPLPNVWLGISAEDQQRADERIPLLLGVPATVKFVSAEPLLGPLDLREYLYSDRDKAGMDDNFFLEPLEGHTGSKLSWVIVGGESGPGARPCNLHWVRSIRDDCAEARVPCFIKQLGNHPIEGGDFAAKTGPIAGVRLSDYKGGDPSEWPEDLRVREFPEREGDCGA